MGSEGGKETHRGRHAESVDYLTMSGDGKRLYSGSSDGIKSGNLEARQEILTLRGRGTMISDTKRLYFGATTRPSRFGT